MKKWILLAGLLAAVSAQQPGSPEKEEGKGDGPGFLCPMDKDVRSKGPGKCPRCGMKLLAGFAEPVEYPVNLKLEPKPVRPGKPVTMRFQVEDPKSGAVVKKFDVLHEKLFHLFLISEDLEYFAHEHPDPLPSGEFRFRTALPKAGMYRVVTDFMPTGGYPQMNPTTIYVSGTPAPKKPLPIDMAPQQSVNLEVELTTEPAQPLAGFKTMMFFKLKPRSGDLGLEQYLGAWGHMLAASEDLIDLLHTHPFLADGGPQVQFNLIFPREGTHRVWVQFQNKGQVNTVAFNIPVKQLR